MAQSLYLTPTPWYVDGDNGIIFGIAPQDNGAVRVCSLLHEASEGERCAADAAMLASAPITTEALRHLTTTVIQAVVNNTAGQTIDWDGLSSAAARAMSALGFADGDWLLPRGDAYQEGSRGD